MSKEEALTQLIVKVKYLFEGCEYESFCGHTYDEALADPRCGSHEDAVELSKLIEVLTSEGTMSGMRMSTEQPAVLVRIPLMVPRYDVIYRDGPVLGIVYGIPAVAPVRPLLPEGAEAVVYLYVPGVDVGGSRENGETPALR